MNDERLRALLRSRPTKPPDFERMLGTAPRRARVRPAVAMAGAVVAATITLVVVSRPREVLRPAAPMVLLRLDSTTAPVARGPDLFEGQRIAESILAVRSPEVSQ